MSELFQGFRETDDESTNLQNVLSPACGLLLWLRFGKRGDGPEQIFLRPNHHYGYLRQILDMLQPAERVLKISFQFRDGKFPDHLGRYSDYGDSPSFLTCTVSNLNGDLANVRWSQEGGRRPKGFDQEWMGNADLYDVGTREMWTIVEFPNMIVSSDTWPYTTCDRIVALKSKIKVYAEK